MVMARRLLLTLGTISFWFVLYANAHAVGQASRAMTSCEATAQRVQLDGKIVTISGRIYLNPHSSNDAPNLLRDVIPCRGHDALNSAVVVSFESLAQTDTDEVFRKLQNDLVPNPCPEKMTCSPPKIARYLYVDVIAVGRLRASGQSGSAYCCTLEVTDILSVKLGPLNSKEGLPGVAQTDTAR